MVWHKYVHLSTRTCLFRVALKLRVWIAHFLFYLTPKSILKNVYLYQMVSMIIEEQPTKMSHVTVFWKKLKKMRRPWSTLNEVLVVQWLRLILIFSVLYDFLYFFRCFSQKDSNVKQNFWWSYTWWTFQKYPKWMSIRDTKA